MALTSVGSGSQACTLDTEHTLDTETTAGTYVLAVDLNALASGGILLVRIKVKAISGGTSRVAFYTSFSGDQSPEEVFFSDPVPVANEIVCTLEQTDGTGRTIPWELLRI